MNISGLSRAIRNSASGFIKPQWERLEQRTYLSGVSGQNPPNLSLVAAPVVYDLASQWSTSTNPNNVWTYKGGTAVLPSVPNWDGDSFTPAQPGWAPSATGLTSPFWFKYSSTLQLTQGAPDWQTGDVVVHTANDTSQNANILWTSPSAGTINISGGVWEGRDIGRSNHWSVLKNGATLTGGDISSGDAFSRAKPFSFGAGSGGATKVQGISVKKGDVIELLLAQTAGVGDYVGVKLSISATPAPTGTISGSVFSDTNANGLLSTGEKGLAGATVYLDTNKNGKLDATETSVKSDSVGNYKFSALLAGTYRVREVLPAGYALTAPTAGYYDVTLLAGATVAGKFFADAPATASIAGRVFNDVNSNGLRDIGEAGMGLWKVFIDFNNNGVVDGKDLSTTTDITGNWSIKSLTAGTYTVRVVPVVGLAATKPTGGVLTIKLTAGQASVGNLFGEKTTS